MCCVATAAVARTAGPVGLGQYVSSFRRYINQDEFLVDVQEVGAGLGGLQGAAGTEAAAAVKKIAAQGGAAGAEVAAAPVAVGPPGTQQVLKTACVTFTAVHVPAPPQQRQQLGSQGESGDGEEGVSPQAKRQRVVSCCCATVPAHGSLRCSLLHQTCSGTVGCTRHHCAVLCCDARGACASSMGGKLGATRNLKKAAISGSLCQRPSALGGWVAMWQCQDLSARICDLPYMWVG